MRGSSSNTFGHTAQSSQSQYGAEEQSVASASSASASGSEAEDRGAGDTQLRSSTRRRRRALKISCELCKTRKVKCDRAEPSCGWCARNSRICVYKERKKPDFRASYGRELEEKINRMEALLHVLGRRLEDHIVDHVGANQTPGPNGPTSASQPLDSTPSLGVPVPLSNSADTTPQNMRTSDTRWPDSIDNLYDGMQYSRPPDAMSIQSMVGIDTPDTFVRPDQPASSLRRTEFDSRSPPLESGLPPHDLTYTLVDLYFKHVNPWCPILDRGATFDALFQSSTIEESDRVLLNAIIATTMRFSTDPRLTPDSRKQYHEASKEKVQQYGLKHANMRALQCLVILTVDVLGSSNNPEGWTLLALVAQNIKHLGLGAEKSVFLAPPTYASISPVQAYALPEPRSWVEDEERRRLYWMVYVLDRYATLGTAFDFILDDKENTRALPCRYDLFSRNEPVETRSFRWAERSETIVNKPENLGSFAYHCEVLRILSRIHQFLRTAVDIGSHTDVQRWRTTYRELDGELNTWIQDLPGEYGRISQLCHSDPASRVSNWIMLHAAYVTSVLRLHSSFAYPIIRSHIFQPSYHAIQRCLGAVKSLREIAQDAVNTGMLDLLGHPFAFSLWVSARLLLVHAAAMECEVDPMIHFFLSTLDQLGQYWPVARNYAEILNRVVQESQQSGNSYEGSRTLTAMRRSAYDLSSALSKRPRTVLDPITTRTPGLNELECLDVFEFFNYPRLPPTVMGEDPSISYITDPIGDTTQNLGQGMDGIREAPSLSMSMSVSEIEGFIFKPPHE